MAQINYWVMRNTYTSPHTTLADIDIKHQATLDHVSSILANLCDFKSKENKKRRGGFGFGFGRVEMLWLMRFSGFFSAAMLVIVLSPSLQSFHPAGPFYDRRSRSYTVAGAEAKRAGSDGVHWCVQAGVQNLRRTSSCRRFRAHRFEGRGEWGLQREGVGRDSMKLVVFVLTYSTIHLTR